MANESVYVAIAIACVVALLMFAIFVIYCIKRQQDKLQERQARERRLREERQRRHHMRVQMVRPPPYEANRGPNQQTGFTGQREIPYSPPPEYKEVATPLPTPRHNQAVGIGGYPPEYTEIPSVSRNVAPANTYYISNSYSMPLGNTNQTDGSNNNNNNSNSNYATNAIINRNLYNQSPRRRNGTPITTNDNTIQVQVSPRVDAHARTALPDVVTSATSGERLANQQAQHETLRASTNRITSNERSGLESTNRTNAQQYSDVAMNREANYSRNVINPGQGIRAPNRHGSGRYQPQAISTDGSGHRANTPASSYAASSIPQNEPIRSANANQLNASSSAQNDGRVSSQLQDLSLI